MGPIRTVAPSLLRSPATNRPGRQIDRGSDSGAAVALVGRQARPSTRTSLYERLLDRRVSGDRQALGRRLLERSGRWGRRPSDSCFRPDRRMTNLPPNAVAGSLARFRRAPDPARTRVPRKRGGGTAGSGTARAGRALPAAGGAVRRATALRRSRSHCPTLTATLGSSAPAAVAKTECLRQIAVTRVNGDRLARTFVVHLDGSALD